VPQTFRDSGSRPDHLRSDAGGVELTQGDDTNAGRHPADPLHRRGHAMRSRL
jgi:hypothetical protein